MCGRYALMLDQGNLDLDFVEEAEFPELSLPWAHYNISPTAAAPMVGPDARWHLARWGLIPPWAKSLPKTPLFNARLETAAEKPSFRTSFKRYRCAVPAVGFYEWTTESGRKQPYFFPKPESVPLLWMAGLASPKGLEGPDLAWSFTILTTDSEGSSAAPYHHRRPVILQPSDVRIWLDPATPAPPDSGYRETPHRVSPQVNRAGFDSPENIRAWSPPDLLF